MKNGLKYAIFKTKWGFFGLLADSTGLLRTVLPMKNYKTVKKYLLVGMSGPARGDSRLYRELQRSIIDYYEGTYVNFKELPFSISSRRFSDFGFRVLKACSQVPIGEVVTYAQLAAKAGFPRAARAAGSVLARNPLPLLIGCHRVIRADGKIGNFSAPGGSKTKKKMLEYEKSIR